MFEQAFKNLDDVLWNEVGYTTELDRTEQASWLSFFRNLVDIESVRNTDVELENKPYAPIIDGVHKRERENWQTNCVAHHSPFSV